MQTLQKLDLLSSTHQVAAVSFLSNKVVLKKYNQFFQKMTLGFECEVSGGSLGDNENTINEDVLRQNFEENWEWDESDYLKDFFSRNPSMSQKGALFDYFYVKPKFGLINKETRVALKGYWEKIHRQGFKVVGLPMQSGDPIMEEPSLVDYKAYTNSDMLGFVDKDTRLINKEFALKKAKESLELISNCTSSVPMNEDTRAVSLTTAIYADTAKKFFPPFIQELEGATQEREVRKSIYQCGKAINSFKKSIEYLFDVFNNKKSSVAVYDDKGKIVILDIEKYDDTGILSPYLEWSEEAKKFFETDYEEAKAAAKIEYWDQELADARSALNEENSSVVTRIHEAVVSDVDEKAVLSQGYHNNDEYKGKFTVVEGDSSISPAGAEIVSPVFTQNTEAFNWLDRVFDMIDNEDMETNSTTGLHVNIGTFRSLSNTISDDLNLSRPTIDALKLAILSGDKYLLKQFGREANTYAKSLAENIQDLAKFNFDFKSSSRKSVQDTLIKLNRIFVRDQSGDGISRYRTINMQHLYDKGYLEFRIAGGTNYHANNSKVRKNIYRYMQLCAIACDPQAYFKDYMIELYKLFVDKSGPVDRSEPMLRVPRPKNVREALYVLRVWNNRHDLGRKPLLEAIRMRLDSKVSPPEEYEVISSNLEYILDVIAVLNIDLYKYIDTNVLYSIRLLMLNEVRHKPNPRQWLRDFYSEYFSTIKNMMAPKLTTNRPQWVKFLFTGSGLDGTTQIVESATKVSTTTKEEKLLKNVKFYEDDDIESERVVKGKSYYDKVMVCDVKDLGIKFIDDMPKKFHKTKTRKVNVVKTIKLEPKKFVSQQYTVSKPGLLKNLKTKSTKLPDVLEVGGHYLINDGTHRVCSGIIKGDKTIKVHISGSDLDYSKQKIESVYISKKQVYQFKGFDEEITKDFTLDYNAKYKVVPQGIVVDDFVYNIDKEKLAIIIKESIKINKDGSVHIPLTEEEKQQKALFIKKSIKQRADYLKIKPRTKAYRELDKHEKIIWKRVHESRSSRRKLESSLMNTDEKLKLLANAHITESATLVYYKNRSTPQVLKKGQKAKAKEGYGPVVKRRKATKEEEKQLRKGKWIRTRKDGKKPGDKGAQRSKYRPQLAKRQKTKN